MRAIRHLVAGCALLLAAGTAAACASPGPAPVSPARLAAAASPVPTPAAADASSLHLPIEAYLLTPVESVERDWVESAAVAACVRRFGFDYPVGTRPGQDGNDGRIYSVMYRRYGVTDPASVRVWGYHLPGAAGAGQAGPAGAMRAKGRGLPAGEQEVLTGADASGRRVTRYAGHPVPSGGCFVEGDTAAGDGGSGVQGPGSGLGGLVSTIKSDSFTASEADPRVRSVFTRWSACMASRGYHLTDPMHATDSVASLNDPSPSPAEIAQAEADVACKAQVNVVGVWFAVESQYQNVAIVRNGPALAKVKARRDAAAARITRLYRRYGG